MDGWYYVEGIIWDDKAQELINKGWSVSCSYDYLAFNDEGGEENNIHYDKEFTQLNFTHLAIVDNPRYERANIVFNSKVNNEDDKNGKWITVKGNHIFIPDGKTLDEVIKEKGWGSKKESKKTEPEWLKQERKKLDRQTTQMYEDRYSTEHPETYKKNLEKAKDKQSDTNEKHGFKKDKDSGYYMKDLSDGTSVYVEKKEGGQGEKEPFYLEATHFDKDGKPINKKQYHYDSMDGMFDKINKDFVSKDKQSDKKEIDKTNFEKYAFNKENFQKAIKQSDIKSIEKSIKDLRTRFDWAFGTDKKQQVIKDLDELYDTLSQASTNEISEDEFENLVSQISEVDKYISDIMTKDYTNEDKSTKAKYLGVKKSKTNNSKEQDMIIIDELKKLIFKVENNKENETMVENEKVDKRKLIDEVAGIMKSAGCDDEDIRTAIGKMEKIGYDDSEASADNKKVKNEAEDEDKKEDKVDNESEEDKEKAEDLKEEEKKDVENKCKNSVENAKNEEFFDKINKIYNSAKKIEEPSVEYESKQARLDAGKEYFG